jgi:uncharacterized protein YhfF
MQESTAVQAYWDEFVGKQPDPAQVAGRFYESFYFSDNEPTANELADLVLAGTKTATSAALWEIENSGKRLIQPGDLSIVTNWQGEPVCVVETTEVRLLPFKDIDEQFAYDYGEGDRTLDWWKTALWKTYQRICAGLNKEASPDMLLVCERFKVIYS